MYTAISASKKKEKKRLSDSYRMTTNIVIIRFISYNQIVTKPINNIWKRVFDFWWY